MIHKRVILKNSHIEFIRGKAETSEVTFSEAMRKIIEHAFATEHDESLYLIGPG